MKSMTPLELAVRTLPKRIKLKKPHRQIFPEVVEFRYRSLLRGLVMAMKKAVQEIVVPELPGMVAASPRRDSYRLDETVAEKLRRLLAAVNQGLDEDFNDAELENLVQGIGNDVNTFNRTQVHRVFKSVLGVDLLSSEPHMAETMAAFVGENVSLISSIKSQYLGEVEQTILRGLRSGLRSESIAEQLVATSEEAGFTTRIGKAESRAEAIARDQTNKLYGQLSELRQTAAGVEKYTWRTAGDSRVRDEHAEREGEVFEWSDPPSGGHPGEDYNCRCWAEPVIELDAEE